MNGAVVLFYPILPAFTKEQNNRVWSFSSLMSLTNYCFPSSYINCVHLIFSYLQTIYTNFHLYNASSNRGRVNFFFYFSFECKPWGKPAVFDRAPLWCKQMFKLCSGRMSETWVHEWCRICPPSSAALFIATTVFIFHAVVREKVRRKQCQVLCPSTAKFALMLCCILYMLHFIHLSINQRSFPSPGLQGPKSLLLCTPQDHVLYSDVAAKCCQRKTMNLFLYSLRAHSLPWPMSCCWFCQCVNPNQPTFIHRRDWITNSGIFFQRVSFMFVSLFQSCSLSC